MTSDVNVTGLSILISWVCLFWHMPALTFQQLLFIPDDDKCSCSKECGTKPPLHSALKAVKTL